MEQTAPMQIGDFLSQKLENIVSFTSREFSAKSGDNFSVFYLDCLVDRALIAKAVLAPIEANENKLNEPQDIVNILSVMGEEFLTDKEQIVDKLLNGFVVIAINNKPEVCVLPMQGWQKRSVTEPPTSAVLKGPREGFTEDYNANLGLVRKRIKSADLKNEELQIGRYTKTRVGIMYIKGIADEVIVKKLKKRIQRIDIDGIIDSYYVSAFIEEKPSLLFKQIGSTEKPDVLASRLLEGRVAIVVEGSPIVLTVPFVLFEDLQSPDDYYSHPLRATFARLIRVFGIVLAISLPGIYVALQSYHYALLPIDFLIALQSSIQGLSFPPLIEILFVLFLFEILNEASVRMPKYLGMALSVIGALVLGDTAVQAGLISPPAVIMVAISGITLYTVPEEVESATVLRLFFTIIGGLAGFYGLTLAFIATTSYLMTFDSYGAPYFAPYSPIVLDDRKDGIFKQTLKKQITRPKSFPNSNRVRQKDNG